MSFNFDSKSSQTKDACSAGKRVFQRSGGKEGSGTAMGNCLRAPLNTCYCDYSRCSCTCICMCWCLWLERRRVRWRLTLEPKATTTDGDRQTDGGTGSRNQKCDSEPEVVFLCSAQWQRSRLLWQKQHNLYEMKMRLRCKLDKSLRALTNRLRQSNEAC